MKKLYPHLSVLLILVSSALTAQTFTWIKGNNQVNKNGSYGSMGVPGASNNPGGREGAGYCQDNSGSFWLFGGFGYDFISNSGLLCDLWRYSPASNQWTHMAGPNLISQAGAYGTIGVPSATAYPGARRNVATWMDATGKLWLFGGSGLDAMGAFGELNDLWSFDPVTAMWTWEGGSNLAYQPGVYGTMGTPSPTSQPGARSGAVAWILNNQLWMFGGLGYNNTTGSAHLNDLWRYDIGTGEWTWMGGTSLHDQNGNYGSITVPVQTNMPGARMGSSSWVDNSGDLWLFGGDGFDNASTGKGLLNDLWKYHPASGIWTWVKGANTSAQNGTYGTQGQSSPSNSPGSRQGGITWRDVTGALWLFGGEGLPATGQTTGQLNDVWRFTSFNNEWMWVKGSSIIDQIATYGSLGIPSIFNQPGARTYGAAWIDGNENLWFFGGKGRAASSIMGHLDDVWKLNNCLIAPITLTVISADSVLCAGESTSLTVSGSNNYYWYSDQSTNSFLVVTPPSTTVYSVSTTNTNACVYTSAITLQVDACTGIASSELSSPQLYPNPSNGEMKLRLTSTSGQLKIYSALGSLVHSEAFHHRQQDLSLHLPNGVYVYELQEGNRLSLGKLVIQR